MVNPDTFFDFNAVAASFFTTECAARTTTPPDPTSESVRRLLERGLLRRLLNHDPDARQLAAVRLGSLRNIGPHAFTELVRRSFMDPSPSVRHSAEISLEELERMRSLHERLADWQGQCVGFDAVEKLVEALIAPSDRESWPYWSAWLEPADSRAVQWVGRGGLTAGAQNGTRPVTIHHLPHRLEAAPVAVATLPGEHTGTDGFVVATTVVEHRTASVEIAPPKNAPLLLVTAPRRPALAA
jgi:hypothetical protein